MRLLFHQPVFLRGFFVANISEKYLSQEKMNFHSAVSPDQIPLHKD